MSIDSFLFESHARERRYEARRFVLIGALEHATITIGFNIGRSTASMNKLTSIFVIRGIDDIKMKSWESSCSVASPSAAPDLCSDRSCGITAKGDG